MTSSLDRRRPIAALPDVEHAIEVDNLRRYWYVSERRVQSLQQPRCQHPPPARPSPPPSSSTSLYGVASPSRSRSCCEFRREYELAQDDQMMTQAVIQMPTSRQHGNIAAICYALC